VGGHSFAESDVAVRDLPYHPYQVSIKCPP
jgi:hypothetical protein